MKITIDGHRVLLDAGGAELAILQIAMERELEFHEGRAARLQADAEYNAQRATRVRGMGAKGRRIAGELDHEASGHRAMARNAADLLRVLREIDTSQELRCPTA